MNDANYFTPALLSEKTEVLTRRYCDFTNGSILQFIGVHSVIRICTGCSPLLLISLVASTIIVPAIIVQPSFAQVVPQKQKVILTAISDQDNKPPLDQALTNLKMIYPNLDIQLKHLVYTYNQLQSQLVKMLNHTTSTTTPGSIDLIALDQIWLGEFVEKGFLTDLTNYTKIWGRQNDWYQQNWDGGMYGGKVYGIWAWTDIRGIWYWKDLLDRADVDPDSLKTWDGYIAAAKKLNSVLRPEGIEGVHLTGASHSPDLWYPYLWMLGGQILKMKSGHPTKGSYWFPAFNSTQDVRAMNFIKQQVDAGIKPQKNHYWGRNFLIESLL